MKHKFSLLTPVAVLILAMVLGPQAAFARDNPLAATMMSDSTTSDTEQQAAEQAGMEQASGLAEKFAQQRREAQLQRAHELEMEAAALKQESEQEQQRQQQRLDAFKKTCDARQQGFKTRLQAIGKNASRRSATIDTLVTRIKQFVTNKNLTVPNYTQLLTAVATQQALVQNLATTISNEASTPVDCSSLDAARNSVLNFRDAVSQYVSGLNAYKTAVKNLIVAVKTAAEQTNQGANNGQAQ